MSNLNSVRTYWEENVCDTKEHLLLKGKTRDAIPFPKYSRAYFEEIERRRVASREFAQPEKYRGKLVLEVGVGSGVDFVQWVRAGATAFGVDLTQAAVDHTQAWLDAYRLNAVVQRGNAESLPFESDTFDLTYSWGVLHHTPRTGSAVLECIRVTRPGGEIKLMLYNRWSILWLSARILKAITGKDIESPGTRAYSRSWVYKLARLSTATGMPVTVESVSSPTCDVDLVKRYGRVVSGVLRFINQTILRNRHGFFLLITLRKDARSA